MDENARCKNCTWWQKGNQPLHIDTNIPDGWGACALGESQYNEPLKKQTLAFANDDESYAALIQTSPEFGCIQFNRKW